MKTAFVSTLVALGFVCLAASCTTNPATGEKNFNIISQDKEIALGVQSEPQFLSNYGGEIPSPKITAYINDLGHRLAAVSERKDMPWEFHVVNSDDINAFALPGGKVFITRGLLSKLDNEAQVAGVLGHEIGHVNAQHISQQMSRQMVLEGVAQGLGTAGESTNNNYLRVLGVGAQTGGAVYLLKFSRDQESQADELGVRYMSRLGYNPIAQVQVMQVLKQVAGSSGGLEMLQTHPLPDTRIERLNTLIKSKYPDYAQTDRYRFNADQFHAAVRDVLPTLPPAPKPKPQPAAK